MRVFVGCSASDSVDSAYKDMASEVATYLAKEGHKLVFGGFDHGMMGKIFMTYKYEGGKTKGIASVEDAEVLESLEVDASDIAANTFERTKKLYDAAEIVLILPGGLGTLAEFFSMVDYYRTGRIKKPIILFNYDDFYTPLLEYLKELYDSRFVNKNDLKSFNIVKDVDGLNFCLKELKVKGEI